MAFFRTIISVVSALSLTACATNPLRLEAAKDFTTTSTSTLAQVRTYLNEVVTRERAANASLIASDPSCIPYPVIYIRLPNNGKQSLCVAPDKATARNSFAYRTVSTSPVQLRARLTLLAAIADYTAAMVKISEQPNVDISAEVSGFVDKIDTLGGLLGFAVGTDLPSASDAVKSKQFASVQALIQFAADLAVEANKVKKFRELVAVHGDEIDQALISVREQIGVWAGSDQNAADTQVSSLMKVYREMGPKWDFDRRSSSVKAILDARAFTADRADAAKLVTDAVDQLAQAHADLRRLLAPNPSLTEQEKNKRRKIASDRIFSALKLILGAAAAFTGV